MTQQMRDKLLEIQEDHLLWSMRNTRNAMTQKQVSQIKRMLRVFCRAIPPNLTNHEKAFLLYQVVTRCVHYNNNTLDTNLRFTYASAILTGSAVCMGISELLYILYNACGIDSRVVLGCITDSENYHAWLQVRLPDERGRMTWYHCDPTGDLYNKHYGSYPFYLKSDRFMQDCQHNWLPERYDPCPQDYTLRHHLHPGLVSQLCREFEKMYSPNRKHYVG